MRIIFEKLIKLFLTSNLFAIICLYIHGEFLIDDDDNTISSLLKIDIFNSFQGD